MNHRETEREAWIVVLCLATATVLVGVVAVAAGLAGGVWPVCIWGGVLVGTQQQLLPEDEG